MLKEAKSMIKKLKRVNRICCCLAEYDEDNNILTYKLLPWLKNCSVTTYNTNDKNTKTLKAAISLVSLERQVSCTSEYIAKGIIEEEINSFYTKQATFLDNIHREFSSDIIFYKGNPIGVIEYTEHTTTVSMYYDNTPFIRVLSKHIIFNFGRSDINMPVVSICDDVTCNKASTMHPSSFTTIIDQGNFEYELINTTRHI